jgi:hypothetical protein
VTPGFASRQFDPELDAAIRRRPPEDRCAGWVGSAAAALGVRPVEAVLR